MTMQSKYLVIPAALAFGAVYGLSALLTDSVAETPATRVAAYAPAAQSAPAYSPDGAYEIRKMMLADMETGEINAAGLRQLEEAVIERAAKDAAAGAKATEHFWNEMGPDTPSYSG